jgi:phenylacetate-CoA ligase
MARKITVVAMLLFDGLRTIRTIRLALEASHWPAERIRARQEELLRALLQHAYDKVPMYRTLYDEAGFHPSAFRSLDDLATVPPLSKALLKATPPEQAVAEGVDLSTCHSVTTSGSTGTPMRVYLGPGDLAWQRAAAWRILFEHGFRWTDRTLEIRMTFGPQYFVQKLGFAPKDWLSILDPPESWARFLADGRHQVVMAGASTLRALALAVEELGLEITPPRIVIADSEALLPDTRALLRRVLKVEPTDVYGLVEASNFVWECERHDGLHVSADSHIVEIDAPYSEVGDLIVTDLGTRTMPIIRYRTGDLASFASEPCACGRTLPRIRTLLGREIDSILLPDGRRLYWPVFHEILGAIDALRQWRLVQESLDLVRLEIVAPQADAALLDAVAASLRRVLPETMALRLEVLDALPLRPGQKLRAVTSNVTQRAS